MRAANSPSDGPPKCCAPARSRPSPGDDVGARLARRPEQSQREGVGGRHELAPGGMRRHGERFEVRDHAEEVRLLGHQTGVLFVRRIRRRHHVDNDSLAPRA